MLITYHQNICIQIKTLVTKDTDNENLYYIVTLKKQQYMITHLGFFQMKLPSYFWMIHLAG